MNLNVQLDEDDCTKILAAIGVAYHRWANCGDTEGAREYTELEKRVRIAVVEAICIAKQTN